MKVNISGTIAKDKRPDSGLDDIGDKLNANRLQRVMVVAMVEYHGHHEIVGQPETITVRFSAIEPLTGEDDLAARNLLDQARRARGVGSTELTLFDDPGADSHDGPWPGDAGYIARNPATAAAGEPGAPVEGKPAKKTRRPRATAADPQGDDAT